MFDTPLSRARCNSFLRYLGIVGRVDSFQIRDDDEYDTVRRLVHDHRVGRIGNDIVNINGRKYPDDNTSTGEPNPLVLELAAETDQGAEFARLYKKNLTRA